MKNLRCEWDTRLGYRSVYVSTPIGCAYINTLISQSCVSFTMQVLHWAHCSRLYKVQCSQWTVCNGTCTVQQLVPKVYLILLLQIKVKGISGSVIAKGPLPLPEQFIVGSLCCAVQCSVTLWSVCSVQCSMCSVQLVLFSVQHATCSVWYIISSVWYIISSVQQISCNMQHAACSMQHAACSMQHATYSI